MKLARTALCLGLLVAAFGCSSSPSVLHGNGVSQASSDRPEPSDYLEPGMSRAAQVMIAELPEVPAVKNSPNQLVLAMPPSLEHDSSLADSSVRQAMISLRSMLSDNEKIKNNFVIISSSDVEPSQATQPSPTEIGNGDNQVHHAAFNAHATKYDPAAIYLLTGKISAGSKTNGQIDYALFFQLENYQSHEAVYHREIKISLKWDGQNHRWAPAP